MLKPSHFSLTSGRIDQIENLRFSYGRHIPYVRQGFGLELLAMAQPDFSGLYDQN